MIHHPTKHAESPTPKQLRCVEEEGIARDIHDGDTGVAGLAASQCWYGVETCT